MNKVVITGHTGGIGQDFFKHFTELGCTVVGFNTETGFDNVVKEAVGCDLFINNTYAEGIQLEFFNQLYASVKKMVVCGSVAADYPDPDMPVYSYNKRVLEQRVMDVINTKNNQQADILLLKLTGASVRDSGVVMRSVDFWLSNPQVTVITFEHGRPNR